MHEDENSKDFTCQSLEAMNPAHNTTAVDLVIAINRI